jgi:hypothetical protein
MGLTRTNPVEVPRRAVDDLILAAASIHKPELVPSRWAWTHDWMSAESDINSHRFQREFNGVFTPRFCRSA